MASNSDHPPEKLSRGATYKLLEARREQSLTKLLSLDERVRSLPAFKTSLTLLNTRFRAATLPARAEILEAAEFSIRVLTEIATRF